MLPSVEPNSLPPAYDNWIEWRETYAAYVVYFNASPKTTSDMLHLEIRLKRLGFTGLNLFKELLYIQESHACA